MKTGVTFVVVVLMGLVGAGCKDDQSTTPAAGEGVISATITNAVTSSPVDGVSVTAGSQSTITDASGKCTLRFTVDSAATIRLLLHKETYRDTVVTVALQAGDVYTLSVKLSPVVPVGGGSGLAQTIAFLGAEPTEVSVYGVGGKETSLLGWEVRDSLGIPIADAAAVNLSFSLVNGPGGGEYVSPTQVTTNNSGQAYTTFNAGTRSGVVQVLASTTVGSRVIQSSPIRVIINGGFPVQSHFTVFAPYYNFPALDWVNKELDVAVLMGDIYSNPVVPGTAVYFRSSAGVIQSSVFSDKNGQGSVTLFSGNPYPYGSYAAPAPLDTAYQYVVAKTVGQNGVTVSDSVLVLWSGSAEIRNLNPTSFAIDSGGIRQFTFTVSDRYHHPLAAGTTITVQATVPPPADPNRPVNQVQLSFGVGGRIVLEDYLFRGPGSTDFDFWLSDGTTNINIMTPVTITISVTGPNGSAVQTIHGTVM